jgi:two-component system, OmpR family, KDP operon response regulator KdpE
MRPQQTILVVDDEPQMLRLLGHALSGAGYACVTSESGQKAVALVKHHPPDLIILDLGLPDLDGKLVAGSIRQISRVPILILSARDQEAEKIAVLDLGANDYVVKPFGIGELLARIRVLLRAPGFDQTESNMRSLGPVHIDKDRHQITVSGKQVHLTPKEFELLELLAANPGRVLTHRHILERVWGPAHFEDIPYLRVFIGQLRQKIEATPSEPKLIVTEPGIGYRVAESDSGE